MTDLPAQEIVRVIREDFSEYVLDDGNTLRVKGVLINFSFAGAQKTDKEGKIMTHVKYQTQPVGGVLNTGKVDTSGLEERNTNQVTDKDRASQIGFKPKKIILNLYETDEFLIVVRYVLKEVWTTKFKDNTGLPLYRYVGGLALDGLPKDTLAPPTIIQK